MGTRKLKPSYISTTGRFASPKNGSSRDFESLLERDYFTWLEFDPLVQGFNEQPVTIPWVDNNGNNRTYTPDVLVLFTPESGRLAELTEIKSRDELRKDWHTLRPKFRAAQRYCRERGWRFRLVTDKTIRTKSLHNLRFLQPYKYIEPDEEVIESIQGVLRKNGSMPAGLIIEKCSFSVSGRIYILPQLWHLVSLGVIAFDIDKPLSMKSTLTLTKEV